MFGSTLCNIVPMNFLLSLFLRPKIFARAQAVRDCNGESVTYKVAVVRTFFRWQADKMLDYSLNGDIVEI